MIFLGLCEKGNTVTLKKTKKSAWMIDLFFESSNICHIIQLSVICSLYFIVTVLSSVQLSVFCHCYSVMTVTCFIQLCLLISLYSVAAILCVIQLSVFCSLSCFVTILILSNHGLDVLKHAFQCDCRLYFVVCIIHLIFCWNTTMNCDMFIG